MQPKACSKPSPRKQGAEVWVGSGVRQSAAKDQGISALYIVLPSLPLKILLYKYLQGNDINEGRELFAVSQDGRIHSSVLQLWKEIFRLEHAGRMEKGGGETSLQGKTKQVRSRGGSRCLQGTEQRASGLQLPARLCPTEDFPSQSWGCSLLQLPPHGQGLV